MKGEYDFHIRIIIQVDMMEESMNKVSIYGKEEAIMAKGLAILSMLFLHLFCAKGNEVQGTPLLWVNADTPFVYFFGYISNICVDLFSLCAGYAQMIIYSKKECNRKAYYKSVLIKIIQLLTLSWLVVILFSLIGVIIGKGEKVPGNFVAVLENMFLLKNINGTWWYLNSYLLLLITAVPFFNVLSKIKKPYIAAACFLAISALYYAAGHFGYLDFEVSNVFLSRFVSEGLNYIHVIIPFCLGALMARFGLIDDLTEKYKRIMPKRYSNWILAIACVLMFFVVNFLHLSSFRLTYCVFYFLCFVLFKKGKFAIRLFIFLGKHSTNIWLTHMFFLSNNLFGITGLVKYPMTKLVVLVILSIASSYLINTIQGIYYEKMNGTLRKWLQ